MASHSAGTVADKVFRFSVGQLMVAVAIVGFMTAALSPLFSDTRVSLLTALLAHVVGLGLGAGIYLIALTHRRRMLYGGCGRMLWRVPLKLLAHQPRRRIDPYYIAVAIVLGFTVWQEI